jgi:hypothetical protein
VTVRAGSYKRIRYVRCALSMASSCRHKSPTMLCLIMVISNCSGLVNYNRFAFHIMMAPSNSKSAEVLVLISVLMDFRLMMHIHSINSIRKKELVGRVL